MLVIPTFLALSITLTIVPCSESSAACINKPSENSLEFFEKKSSKLLASKG